MSTTAIAILNWNNKKYLESYLPSVIKYSDHEDISIYLIDNGSTDDSVNFVSMKFPQIKIIVLDKNYGFAEGYNRGLNDIKADYFLLLNSDVEVTENWIEPLIKKMEENHNIAACMPKIKALGKKEYFEYAGAAGGFLDKYGYPFCRGRIFGVVEKDTGQYDFESSIFWTTGACMLIRSKLFFEAGGFDKDFFAHMEEIDLCWRLKNMGYKFFYIPSSTVYHLGGGTLSNSNPFKTYLNFRNNLFLLYKNVDRGTFIKIIPIRYLFDFLSVFRFLLLFQYSNAFAVIKAHFSFLKNFKKLQFNKNQLLTYTNTTSHPEIINKSLILNFFLKRKNTYLKLVDSKKTQK